MIEKIKTLFIDLDGTALDIKINGKWTLSDENKKAIAEARAKGMEIIASTGRIGWTANRVIKEVGGNYFIQGNGSLITNQNNEVIFENKMTKIQVIKIINFAQKHKLILRPSLDHKIYGISTFLKRYIAKKWGTSFATGYTLDMTVGRHKILLFGFISKFKVQKLTNKINKMFKNLIAVTSLNGCVIEITAKGSSKGHAANFIAKKMNLKKSQMAHIGDTMNDSTTKDFVGTLIAMKNADKKLKEIADYIGPNYKRGGLAKFLQGEYRPNKLL